MGSRLQRYEAQRLKNQQENIQQLKAIGLDVEALNGEARRALPAPSAPAKKKVLLKKKRTLRPSMEVAAISTDENVGNTERRRSARISGQPPKVYNFYEYAESVEPGSKRRRGAPVGEKPEYKYAKPAKDAVRPNIHGPITEPYPVAVGETFVERMEASYAGVHRPTVAGISGSASLGGATSICLSGGYEDDVDCGEFFTYTGQGGRDLKGTKAKPKNLRTAPQSKDQVLESGNLALATNVETGKPVRVLRGYQLTSDYAPDHGYRYDGLYTVEKYWEANGLSGFKVYRFAMKRCPDQAPPPWETGEEKENPAGEKERE